MPVIHTSSIPERLLAPGIHAHPMHGDALTVVHVNLDANCKLPRHKHPHEQAATVISGRLFLTIGDVEHELTPGMTAFIPGNVEHEGRTVEPAVVIDLFTPTRDDLR